MGASIQIGRIFGINVRINTTLLLLFGLFAYWGYEREGWGGVADDLTLLVFLFLSIFLHEMGHAAAAAAFGIKTEDVVLHFFGGYARFAEPPRRPLEEAAIAIAGPIVNLAIALAFYLVLRAYESNDSYAFLSPYEPLMRTLVYANIFLALFNLLPGFPLDGGSFLRAILSLWLPRPTARIIVGCLGVLVGLGIAAWGFSTPMDTMTVVLGFLLALLAFGEATNARRARAAVANQDT
jgi:Zn-dependent protease